MLERGEPLPRAWMAKGFGFDEPCRGLDEGLFSWGGEGAKHSSSDGAEDRDDREDMEDMLEEKSSMPAPNLKGGRGCCS